MSTKLVQGIRVDEDVVDVYRDSATNDVLEYFI